jgi:hypothetical protein
MDMFGSRNGRGGLVVADYLGQDLLTENEGVWGNAFIDSMEKAGEVQVSGKPPGCRKDGHMLPAVV